MKKLKNTLSILFLVSTIMTFAQTKDHFSLFTNRSFYKPFVSEISSTLSNVSIGSAKNTSPAKELNTTFTEIHLGADFPLLYGEGESFGWAVFLPVSFHMLWAPFEETTAPIINNDYRFGLSFAGIKYFNGSLIKNLSFKITPFAHESTHLGDEISIFGVQNLENFYRVNVSYEYYELGITINDPDTLTGNLFSVRLGLMGLINPTKGYYGFFENEIGDKPVYPSKRWAEFYVNLNYNKNSGFLTTKSWKPSISLEIRNRVKYEYEKEEKADREWCINAFIGYNYIPRKTKGVKSVGHYFRYYDGINPHGQFRNIYYRFIGYSLVLFY